jgi:threonine/homoserine/homoserine lactone efflux protein
MQNPLLFLLTVLAILGTPGPTNTLLATSGASIGARASLRLLPAEACGYLISILVLGLVVGPVVAASPVISVALRLAVGGYLFFLAVGLWRQGVPIDAVDGDAVVGAIRPRQVFVTTLLNPKAIIFALGVIPFGSPHVWVYLVGFVVILAMVGTGWLLVGAGMGRMARDGARAHMVPRVGAAAVGAFATMIVISPFLR